MVDLTNPDKVQEWVNKLEVKTGLSFVARMMLRELPCVFSLRDQYVDGCDLRQLFLICLRSNIVCGVESVLQIPKTSTEFATASFDHVNHAWGGISIATKLSGDLQSAAFDATKVTQRALRISSYSHADSKTALAGALGAIHEFYFDTSALAADIDTLTATHTDSKQLFATELWDCKAPAQEDQRIQEFLEGSMGTPWEFWADWYEGMLKGEPLDWELQRRVALIGNSVWNVGPEAVAEKIEQIQARWEVEKALSDTKDSLTVRGSARHGIGGNNPPESIEDELLPESVTFIWEATEELSTAMEEENPGREWVEAILAKLKAGFLALAKWLGRKVDLAVDTAIVTAIKQGVRLAGGYYALDKLIKAIEDWLPHLH